MNKTPLWYLLKKCTLVSPINLLSMFPPWRPNCYHATTLKIMHSQALFFFSNIVTIFIGLRSYKDKISWYLEDFLKITQKSHDTILLSCYLSSCFLLIASCINGLTFQHVKINHSGRQFKTISLHASCNSHTLLKAIHDDSSFFFSSLQQISLTSIQNDCSSFTWRPMWPIPMFTW